MNVTCTHCQTVFRVDPDKIPAAGVRARCSVCAGVFWVRRDAVETVAHTPAAEPAAPAPAPIPEPPPIVPVVQAPAPAPAPTPAPAAVPFTQAPFRPSPAPAPPAPAFRGPGTSPPPAAPAAAPVRPAGPPPPVFAAPVSRPAPAPPAFAAPAAAPVAAPAAVPMPPVAPAPVPAKPKRPTNPFLSQDPAARARRLARALVSDIVVYHPAKRRDGLRDGSLKLLFEEEIKKSWEEYVDQVGRELAETSTFFTDALNEILADGQPVFP